MRSANPTPDVADIALARVHTIIQYVYTLPVATFEGLNAVEEDLRDALRDVAVGTFPQDVLDELHRAVRERRLGLEELAIRRAEAEAARAFDLRGQHLRARLEADQYQRRHETDYEVQMREEWEEDKEEMRAMEGWIKVSLTESGVERVREEIGVEVGEDGIMFVRFGP
ncbi:hypothetical protein B0A54_17085 [Friedmanniomyces endolithicus]|uniref:Uncharacterized protein n=1 Tax=Friedmanniomyces endolithicus TaxID=329885 RepID=A0A4U0TTH2_9PEZI|nr:hypothetical protein B0A54_17085 [Friedmanniomyces endolithicus]